MRINSTPARDELCKRFAVRLLLLEFYLRAKKKLSVLKIIGGNNTLGGDNTLVVGSGSVKLMMCKSGYHAIMRAT